MNSEAADPASLKWPDCSFPQSREEYTPQPITGLAVTYLIVPILLYFCVRGVFSFQYANINTAAASSYGGLVGVGPGTGSSSTLQRVELATVYLAALSLIFRNPKLLIAAWRLSPIPFCLASLGILSTAWSQDPLRSFLFGVMAMINLLFAVYLVERWTPDRLMQLYLTVGIVASISSLLVAAILPAAGVDHKSAMGALQGIYSHKNVCAMASITFMFTAILYPFRRYALLKRLACTGLFASLIVLSTSRTGWLLALLSLLFISSVRIIARFKGARRALIVVITCMTILVGAAVIVINYASIALLLGKDPTLTGRTVIWSTVFTSAMKRPVLGFGYNAFWLGFTGEAANAALMSQDLALSNAENGMLAMWLELGLVGVAIVLLMVWRTSRLARACLRVSSSPAVLWYATFLFFSGIYFILAGGKVMLPHSIDWTMYVITDAGLCLFLKTQRGAECIAEPF
jgi:exopolysaccharide production protein ExoQ